MHFVLESTLFKKSISQKSIGFAFVLPLLVYAQSQEQARVVSVTPVIKQVSIPQQVCGTSQVAVQEPKTGEGAVVGAVAGGIVGNALGKGAGKGASTALGAVGGAIVGNQLETPKVEIQNVTNCSTQSSIQNVTSYQVTYEYAGRQYGVEMPNPPGQFVNIQVSIAVQGASPTQNASTSIPPPGVIVPAGVVYAPPAYPAPGVGWVWEFNPRFGWGWRHPRYGWHQGWR